MSTEELLRPRYKCIADYPCAIHKVGDLINTYDTAMSYAVEVAGITEKICLQDYPILFQKLEWWQERKPEEMPEYVKHSGGEVIRVDGWEKDNEERSHGVIISNEFKIHNTRHISWFLPATLEEYNQYQSSIKHL